MNYLDIIILVPMAWAAYRGFTKGFIIEIFGLLALAVGIYGSIHFSDYTAVWLREEFEMSSEFLPVISFSLTFLALVIVVHLLGKTVEKVAHIASLKLANKLFGSLFGLLKAALILSAVLIVLKNIDAKAQFLPQDKIKESLLFEPVHNLVAWLIPAIEDSELYQSSKDWDFDFIPDQLKPNSD